MNQNQRLKNKVAIIVGASSGMGRETAVAFANRGAKLVLASRNEAALISLSEELDSQNLVCPTDAGKRDQVEKLIAKTLETFGRIDMLVYATGTNIPNRSLEKLDHETWDMMVSTNLTGAFNCTKAVIPVMEKQEDGLIIYISSISVTRADVSGVSYQASKHGLSGLAHGTFVEKKDKGIRTTVIFPGLCDTPLVLQRPVKTPDDVLAKALQPQDVADACLYVATAPRRARIGELTLQPTEL
jgi:NADP-dependent 3-hydroxy acid dehydrogenase YdfG